MKNFPKDIVIIWFDGAMMSKDDFVEVAAVKITDGNVSEYCQYFVNVDIDGKPIDADRLPPSSAASAGSICLSERVRRMRLTRWRSSWGAAYRLCGT